MSLIRALAGGLRAYGPTDDFWYSPVGQTSLTGLKVDALAALSASPVWAAVRLMADSVASMPLITYRRLPGGGKERATDHRLYDLLHNQPNQYQHAASWLRVSMVHALLWGNSYSEIVDGRRGMADELVPIHPDVVRMERQRGGRRFVYFVRQDDGREREIRWDMMLHLPGLSLDGISGLSVMSLARETVGVNLAAKQHSARFFGQGGRPSGVIKHPSKLSKDGRKNLRESWQEIHGGLQGSHRVAILDEGMEWQQTGLNAEDAQLLGLLEWSAADCARYFNVPLHLLQETSKVTSWGSGIAELQSAFVTYSLMPWLVNWQQTIAMRLLLPSEREEVFCEFLTDALLRGKTLERFQAYAIATGGQAWMTGNEVRERENLNPLDGLDEVTQPAAPGPPTFGPEDEPMPEDDDEETAEARLNGHLITALEVTNGVH